jgi:hypothetical protein
MAGDLSSTYIGDEDIDDHSDAFTQWIMNLAYQE